MKIAVGSDHGGFALKEAVKKHLEAKGIEVEDFGCYSTESVDYAVYGAKVAHCVADGKADYGVLVCSTGIGISMAANKVKGIRAALCSDTHAAEMTRRHNNANILCLGGLVTEEKTALEIVDTFLKSDLRAAATSAVSTRSQILKTDACKAEIGEINMGKQRTDFYHEPPAHSAQALSCAIKTPAQRNFASLSARSQR